MARPSADINLGQLVRTLEHSLAPVDCAKPYCILTPACQLRDVLGAAVAAYLAVLDRHSLADIVSNGDELMKLLPDPTISVLQLG